MSWTGEEERAVQYRATMTAREGNRVARERAMAGNAAARAALDVRWAGTLEWLAERREPCSE